MQEPIKRILVISDYRPTHTVRPEAEIFISLQKLGYEITIMTHPDTWYGQRFKDNGIRVIEFHPQKKYDKAEIAFIREELIKGDYQLVHLFNSPATVNGIQAAKNLPVKVVLYRGYSGNINWWDPWAYTKYLHPRVDKIICNSIGVEAIFNRQLGFDKTKALTINKGHDSNWYKGITKADLSEFNIQPTDVVFICVANNRRMKGVPYLLKAIAVLPENIPFKLLLVGSDMQTPQNMNLLKGSKNASKVIFTGYRNDSLSLVAASNVFILPSIKGESITKSVIEAMSLGVCPLITDIPGNVELVKHNECGLVVPKKNAKALAQAILELATHPDKVKKFALAAPKYIEEELPHSKTVAGYVALYNSLSK